MVPPLRACRVLLADDDPLIRTVYVEALRGHGCDVTEAPNGAEAVRLAASARPDLVLLDLSMPELDGWGAVAALRAEASTAGLVVIALTASATAEVRERALAAGFDAFLIKPMTPHALLRDVEDGWSRARIARGDTPPAADAPHPAPAM